VEKGSRNPKYSLKKNPKTKKTKSLNSKGGRKNRWKRALGRGEKGRFGGLQKVMTEADLETVESTGGGGKAEGFELGGSVNNVQKCLLRRSHKIKKKVGGREGLDPQGVKSLEKNCREKR